LSTSTSTGPRGVGHGRHQLDGLPPVRDVGREGLGDPTAVPDGGDDLERQRLVVEAVDGHGQAVATQPVGDGTAQPACAAGHEGDTPG
jgi:hypothetical protein